MPRLRCSDFEGSRSGKIPPLDPSLGRLTSGEREVAEFVADGLRNPEISDRLDLAPATVDTYIGNVKGRLGLTTRAEIAAWVLARRMPGSRDGRL